MIGGRPKHTKWRLEIRHSATFDERFTGYCLHYGIGARRDLAAAIARYRRVVKSHYVSAFGQEEAQYQLAIALLDRGLARDRVEAGRLLTKQAFSFDTFKKSKRSWFVDAVARLSLSPDTRLDLWRSSFQ